MGRKFEYEHILTQLIFYPAWLAIATTKYLKLVNSQSKEVHLDHNILAAGNLMKAAVCAAIQWTGEK